ncbi:GNAT family N-acetyltransferase [Microbispora rosea]|uniref:GNAT family N-acetyltransferase n=1 Tax=Microbispora rosea TaxID=58117 RepID=UPI003D9482AB
MLMPLYPLKTARLLLRPYTFDDFDAFHDIQSRDDVTRYLRSDNRDREEARQELTKLIGLETLREEGDKLVLAVELPATGTLIGDVGLFWTSREHRQGEIGYIFHPDHSGKGYATEAATEMLRLGFEVLGLHRIAGSIDARNDASARVLQRLGMRREARFVQNEMIKGEWTDEVVYAMLNDEWRAREKA